jgi:hypothetical protein
MSLASTLIILKYSGTAISRIAGIWGTVSETRDKITGRLSKWGKCAFGLVIAGFAVALGFQIAEQINSRREKEETRSKRLHPKSVCLSCQGGVLAGHLSSVALP